VVPRPFWHGSGTTCTRLRRDLVRLLRSAFRLGREERVLTARPTEVSALS
jgi:hypothetical protein